MGGRLGVPEHVPSLRGLAQTSVFEVYDAPEVQPKVRRSAPGSLPDRSLREIADSTERSLRHPAEKTLCCPARDMMSLGTGKRKRSNFKKMDERCANVIENKGPLWKTSRKSGNVYENKST